MFALINSYLYLENYCIAGQKRGKKKRSPLYYRHSMNNRTGEVGGDIWR